MPPANFRSNKSWQKSHDLTLRIHEITRGFPREELVGLTSHLRRVTTTITTRIVDAIAAETEGEIRSMLRAAEGATNELDYQLLLSHDLHYIDDATYDALSGDLSEVRRLLGSFQTRIRANR